LSRAGWYKKSKARDQSALRLRIREIAMNRPRFGYERIHVVLRREGWKVNRKRVHRLYRLEGLQVRMRVRHAAGVDVPVRVKQSGRAEQLLVVEDLARSSDRDDASRFENDAAIGDVFDDPEVVRCGDRGL